MFRVQSSPVRCWVQSGPWHGLGHALILIVAGALSGSAFGCFYDSTWGQAKAAQKNAAQHYGGAELGQGAGSRHRLPPRKSAARRVRLLAYATPEHATQVVNWQARLTEALERANPLLSSSVGIELELAEGGYFRPTADPDDLGALLEELERTYPAAEGEWVVGLVGSLARLERSFHQLGVGRLYGTHMVVRAANDALEYDAILDSYTELSTEEREAFYRSRRAHQASAVLIHELGHCLGAIHVQPGTDLMHASYNNEMSSLSEPVAELMRITLEQRFLSASERNEQALLDRLEQQLNGGRGLWVQKEELELRARLAERRSLATAGVTAPSRVAPSRVAPANAALGNAPANAPRTSVEAAPAAVVPGLAEAEQALFERLLQQKRDGRVHEAWAAGAALFREHSDLRSVAELRCELAMAVGLDWSQTRTECEPLLQQTGSFNR